MTWSKISSYTCICSKVHSIFKNFSDLKVAYICVLFLRMKNCMAGALLSSGRRWKKYIFHPCVRCFTVPNCSDKQRSVRSVWHKERMAVKLCYNFWISRSLCNLFFLATETPVKMERKYWVAVLKSSLSVESTSWSSVFSITGHLHSWLFWKVL